MELKLFFCDLNLFFFSLLDITHCSLIFDDAPYIKQMVELRFGELLDHSMLLLKKKWLFGILDDFTTKQLPHNVTWGLSLLYAVEHKGDRSSTTTQGEINKEASFFPLPYPPPPPLFFSPFFLSFSCSSY